jgi:hypothetical protein
MVEIKRISYAYNSECSTPYFLDAMIIKDGMTLVDVHRQLATKEEFDAAIEGLIPMIDEPTRSLEA